MCNRDSFNLMVKEERELLDKDGYIHSGICFILRIYKTETAIYICNLHV